MFRVLMIFVLVFMTSMSWALDWNVCRKDLEGLKKVPGTGSNARNLAAARDMAIKLRFLYDDIQTRTYEFDRCRNAADDTQYCVETQRRMNTLISDYENEMGSFNKLMLSFSKYAQSSKEPCGFKLN